jgi:hypothetical protein
LRVDDNWHDEATIERALPDIVKLAESIVSLCRRTNWETLDSSRRPKALQAAIVEDIERLIERVRIEDSEAIDSAIRAIPDAAETDRKVRWREHCFQIVVMDAVAFARELVRDDNAHRARLSSREDSLRRSIVEAAKA